MQDKSAAEVIQFSQLSSRKSTRCVPLRIRGEVTFSKLKPHSLKLLPHSLEPYSARPIPVSLMNRLETLDDEQLQIVEIIAAAFQRGVL